MKATTKYVKISKRSAIIKNQEYNCLKANKNIRSMPRRFKLRVELGWCYKNEAHACKFWSILTPTNIHI